MERMLLFYFSIEKNKLAGLVKRCQQGKKKPYRAEREARQGKGRQQDFKALKCFISLKNESRKNRRTEKTDPFYHLKKISCTSKLKNI